MSEIKYIVEPGQKFGNLEAIIFSHSNKRQGIRFWTFKCYCGKEFTTNLTRVRIGKTKSCGCLKKTINRERLQIIPGQKIGRLTLIDFSHRDNKKQKIYKWKCDCGNETMAKLSCVYRARKRSCGCLRTEYWQKNNRMK